MLIVDCFAGWNTSLITRYNFHPYSSYCLAISKLFLHIWSFSFLVADSVAATILGIRERICSPYLVRFAFSFQLSD